MGKNNTAYCRYILTAYGCDYGSEYHINPIEQLWLGEKLLAVVAYIFTGYFTLKLARNRPMQIIGYLGAIGWVMLIVRLAITREPLFLL